MSQKKLTFFAVLVPSLIIAALLITFGNFGKMVANTFASFVLFVGLFILPLFASYYVIDWLIPSIDALSVSKQKKDDDNDRYLTYSERNRDREFFPKPVRVLLWGTIGIMLALFWTWLVPNLLAFPTYFGLLARGLGWQDLASTDSVWQYGWLIVFLIEYALILFGKDFSYKNE